MPTNDTNATTIAQWVSNGDAVVIDVREPIEFESERIEGAISIPLSKINASSLSVAQGKKVVIHCRGGKRGMSACQKLTTENPSLELYHLDGGILAWKEANLPVLTSNHSVLPLDRQVQVTVGAIIFLSSLMAYFVDPIYILLTCFIGAGLALAGLTGFCGLALVLAKMPWNQSMNDCAKNTSCQIRKA